MERQRWSYSKMMKLVRCGEAFRREEVEKEYPPPTSSMVRGTAVHAVAAAAHLRQLSAREMEPKLPRSIVLRRSLPSPEEAADLAATRFDAEARETGVVAPEDEIDTAPAKVIVGRDKDASVRMSRHYVESVAPYRDPIYVERRIVVEPENLPIRLTGIIDLGTRDDDGGEVVRDLKTGEASPQGRRPGVNLADDSDQLSMYALLRKLETGSIPSKVALDYVVAERRIGVPPYVVTMESTRVQADLDVAAARLENAIAAATAGAFVANGPGSWMCSPKWCRFHPTCRFVRHR